MRHPHSTPLRTIAVGRNNLPRGVRPSNTAKRKSAVELLQETKAFYVKSETVLDKKQEFRPTRSPDSYMAPSQPAKSPRCSQYGSELQDRLRILLDFDSKENVDARATGRYGEKNNYRKGCDRGICLSQSQHKSLPDLHVSPGRSSTDTSESSYEMRRSGTDSRSAYSSVTQPEYGSIRGIKRSDFRRSGYAVDDGYGGNGEFAVSDPRIYASLRVTKSGEFVDPRTTDALTYYRRRNSNTSSGNRSQHNSGSRHSQSADSGRQSQGGSGGLRTGRSGLPDATSPPPLPFRDPESDSGAEDESPPLYRSEICERDKKRPILRSKSDISYRYCANRPMSTVPPPPLLTTDRLEKFFDHLGMDPVDYREMAAWDSRCSSPVFFSSVSSIDSCMDSAPWGPPEPEKPTESPSIVEKNARIIKWLCNCRKAQATRLTLV